MDDITDNFGNSPLMLASGSLFLFSIRSQLESGANPHHTNMGGQTALHLVADFGYKNEPVANEIIRILLEYGANVNASDFDGVTPLMLASYRRAREIVSFLLQNGADVNARRTDDGTTILGAIQSPPSLRRRSKRLIRLLEAAGGTV